MPIVRIPVARLREHYIGKFGNPPDPLRDLLRVYGERMLKRGFKMTQDAKGRWHADPPVNVSRDDNFLTLEQTVEGRVSDRNMSLRGYLDRIRAGDAAAIQQLQGFLFENNDDRAAMFELIEASMPEGATEMSEDSGLPADGVGGRAVPSHLIAQREICNGVLRLFGRFDPTEGM